MEDMESFVHHVPVHGQTAHSTTGVAAGLEDRDLMTVHFQSQSHRQSCNTSTDDRYMHWVQPLMLAMPPSRWRTCPVKLSGASVSNQCMADATS